ncbi:MAG: DUF5677 domain-containing protein [Desulfobaccales bacterium]
MMRRIDICETIKRIEFPEKIWEWLDFFGEIVATTQQEARIQERHFLADSPYKKLLVCSISKDLSTLNAIYILLRCELIHQAATHIRLLCESLIMLQYISMEPESRSDLFWGYSNIEAFEISSSILDWEGNSADPVHVARLKKFKESILEQYNITKNTYTFQDKKGRRRLFSNWCNKSISKQAQNCGQSFQRLYPLVYRQLSAYIHGSAWSLRRQLSYNGDYYQLDVVHNDIASIIRTALVVWIEWANFCNNNLNWRLETIMNEIPVKLN